MALPPCHKTYQFHVAGQGADARLNCCSTSGAATWRWVCLQPVSAALLQRMLAQRPTCCRANWSDGGDTHLYLNHAN